ncbi:hypothetical protein ACFQ9J_16885 [Streptomyces sp. NPDC056529]|uniref:hypothetical protein n=1 Tax=Streptomyces sp. NPDC056529 TaxID=3345855 RepID=UPI003697ED9C
MGTLYALADPRDGAVRYIGQTTKDLSVRLAGHVNNPASRVRPWVQELVAAGLTPIIAPLREDVPVPELLAAEREEITRRLIDGEDLLNQASTAVARKVLRERAERAARERHRSAWQKAAQHAREVLGGPLAPGSPPPIRLSEQVMERIRALWVLEAGQPADQEMDYRGVGKLSQRSRFRLESAEVSEALWEEVRGAWRFWRYNEDTEFTTAVEARVAGILTCHGIHDAEAARYVSLVPWAVSAVAPWGVLAQQAGLPYDGPAFISWVTGNPEVRDALEFLSAWRPSMIGSLVNIEAPYGRAPASVYLAAAALAHGDICVPEELEYRLTSTLQDVARDNMLTPPMARLLARLRPQALDDVFGSDVASQADQDLGLPLGTAAKVASYLAGRGNYGVLDRVAIRAAGELPSTPFPDYSSWRGPGVCTLRVMVGSQVAARLISSPEGQTEEDVIHKAQSVWMADEEWVQDRDAA